MGALTASLGADSAIAAGSPYFTQLTNSLTTARGDAVAASLPEGRVLIVGGQEGSAPLSSAELFDPKSDTFTKLEGTGREAVEARQGAIAAALPDGEVLIAGGSNSAGFLSSAELFDPASDTFTKLEGPGSEMTIAREHPQAAALQDGDVLIVGGEAEVEVFPGFAFPEVVSSAELFDPASDTFTKLEGPGSETVEPRWGAAMATLPDGEVLIAGGRGPQDSAELFNPTSDTFSKLEGAGSGLVESRQGAVAATLPDGEVLIAGGLHNTTNLSSAELFDPASDTFTKLEGPGSSLTEVGEFGVAVTLSDGRVLVAGGANEHSWLSDADVFYTSPDAAVVGGNSGDQTVGESRTSTVVVTNLGAQGLSFSGASIEGTDATDWTIGDNGCSRRTLSFGQSCAISLIFGPSAEGSLEATLKLADNELSGASVTSITGTGVAANQGPEGPEGEPGATGPSGAQGAPGATGSAGAAGATGATGPAGATGATGATGAAGAKGAAGAAGPVGPSGPEGEVELIVCTSTKAKNGALGQQCEVKLSSSPFKFTGRGRKLAASLYQSGRLYTKGFALLASNGKLQLLLGPLHTRLHGHYTLTIDNKRKQQRESITIG